jgi:hypothetical protein
MGDDIQSAIQNVDPNAFQINDTLLVLGFVAGCGILFLIAWIQDWYERLSARRRNW